MYIAKLRNDKTPFMSNTPASQIEVQGLRNFLGGTGKVHTMQFPLSCGNEIMLYDDDSFYVDNGKLTIPHSGTQLTEVKIIPERHIAVPINS